LELRDPLEVLLEKIRIIIAGMDSVSNAEKKATVLCA
jgi:hypothetical protein